MHAQVSHPGILQLLGHEMSGCTAHVQQPQQHAQPASGSTAQSGSGGGGGFVSLPVEDEGYGSGSGTALLLFPAYPEGVFNAHVLGCEVVQQGLSTCSACHV